MEKILKIKLYWEFQSPSYVPLSATTNDDNNDTIKTEMQS